MDEVSPSEALPPRQTRGYLLQRFEQVGIRPKTRHGQNFLIDLNLLRLLFDSGEVCDQDVVLEVGTGTGSLTTLLAQAAAQVISVEIDPQLHQLASEELHRFGNVTLLLQDALKNKNHFSPGLIEQVQAVLSEPGRRFKLVANLPYNVATPVISNLLVEEPLPELMAVTIQRELAERIVAAPGSKDYGALSIWIQSQCDVELVRVMAPTVFFPRPKVESAIVQIRLRRDKRARLGDVAFFHSFVRSMFFHRRKFLRSELLSAFKGQLDKPQVDEIMSQAGHGPDARAEQLDVDKMIALCEIVQGALAP